MKMFRNSKWTLLKCRWIIGDYKIATCSYLEYFHKFFDKSTRIRNKLNNNHVRNFQEQ